MKALKFTIRWIPISFLAAAVLYVLPYDLMVLAFLVPLVGIPTLFWWSLPKDDEDGRVTPEWSAERNIFVVLMYSAVVAMAIVVATLVGSWYATHVGTLWL